MRAERAARWAAKLAAAVTRKVPAPDIYRFSRGDVLEDGLMVAAIRYDTGILTLVTWP